ncbi:hypothetical protein [Paenibacillus sp. y28]|uniref:hypothetical protein n=1 Tax=Paenibacillus sp. y28 TaxID=3129110 RepID=UPI003018B7D4
MQRTLSLIWKYKAHYVIAFPAVLLVLLIKRIPMIISVAAIGYARMRPDEGNAGAGFAQQRML